MTYEAIGEFDLGYFWGVMVYPTGKKQTCLGMPPDEFDCWDDADFRQLKFVPHAVGKGLMDFLELYPDCTIGEAKDFAMGAISDCVV